MASGSQKGGTLLPYHSPHQFQTPTGKDVRSASHKKTAPPATQPRRNCHHPEHQFFSNGLSFSTNPPNFFLLHEIPSLCFVALAYGFCHSLLIPNHNSLFLNKPIFASKLLLRSTSLSIPPLNCPLLFPFPNFHSNLGFLSPKFMVRSHFSPCLPWPLSEPLTSCTRSL